MLRFLALCAMAFGDPEKADSAPARPPNLILILADDLGWSDVGFNGRTEWQTPAIDRIAREGVILDRFYTNAVVCAPSRAALLSGRSSIHNGVTRNNQDLPASEVTLAEALRARAYRTALFGKWHQGQPRENAATPVHPLDQGFDEFFGFLDATHAWEKFPRELWNGRSRVTVNGYADDLFAERAITFLEAAGERPFFLYLPFTNNHFSIEAPAEEVARYRGSVLEPDPARPIRATYAAMSTRLDRNVQRVLDALDRLNLSAQTLVVFTSDHGATFEVGNLGASAALDSNRPFRGQKRTLWEGGIRVPCAIRWQGRIPPGTRIETPMQMIDLYPTFLAAAGSSDSRRGLDGGNVLNAWQGQEVIPDRTLFWEWRSEGFDQVAALAGPWKLVITRGGRPELYDVVQDPAERRDLAAGHPDRTKEMRQALEAWLQSEERRSDSANPQVRRPESR